MEEPLFDNADLDEAVEVLRQGGVILYPTDTVWGLGCDATNPEAVEKIYAIKRRSDSKSLISLVADADMLGRYVKVIPEAAINLIEVNDRPMTIIYPDAISLAPNAIAPDGTAGIRIPSASGFCVRLIRRFRKAIISTSANVSGQPAPSCYDEIPVEILEAVDWTADPCLEEGATGQPSQIIKVGLRSEIEIIRQ